MLLCNHILEILFKQFWSVSVEFYYSWQHCPECLRGLTRVAALGVDAHVAVWTRARVLMTLVDVHTRDQEELISRRTLCRTPRLWFLFTHVRSHCVHTNTSELAIKKILFFTLEKKLIITHHWSSSIIRSFLIGQADNWRLPLMSIVIDILGCHLMFGPICLYC